MTTSSIQRSSGKDADTVFWAGVAMAAGAVGIVIASALYAMSPVAAALPTAHPSFADAHAGMIAGSGTMRAAGIAGMLSDIVMATGTLMLMMFRPPAGLAVERAGWALVTASILVFIVVDGLAAGVLTQVASLGEATAAFAGFKLLFDTFFILGTVAFGIGVPAILASEMKSATPVLANTLIWAGMLAAGVGLLSGLLYFADVSLPQPIGISVALVCMVFAIYGIKIARSVRAV